MGEFKRSLNLLKKTACSALIRLCLQPMKLLPVRKNRILFSSYMEKQYSCNPKYISEELKKRFGGSIEIGWAFRQPEKFAYLKEKGIAVLGSKSRAFYRFALTSRAICVNTYFKPSLPRRKKQFIVNTWHGGGAYKKVGRYVDMPLIERLNTRMREGKTDLFLSSSRFFTDSVLRDSFGYKGEVLEKGMPRNDLLVNAPDEAKQAEIRQSIGLKPGQKLCLFAPTYRRDTQVHDLGFDYEAACKALSKRFGGEWVMGYRSHHVTMFKDNSSASAGTLDLTASPDMQELLYVSDALITDYSSSIWDAALRNLNTFLYAPDLDDYLKERSFYMNIESWPCPLAKDMDGLVKNIENFDEEKYRRDAQRHLSELGSCETGEASRFAAERIAREMGLEEET
jgi:CDP-glycerol glycerophosphotransferase